MPLILVAAWALSGACRAGPDIYLMIDERGVPTLSDIAQDGRYRRLGPAPAPIGPMRSADAPAAVPAIGPRPRRKFEAEVQQAAKQFGVDPALVHAVISVESAYDPMAVSRRGASGLMQLMAKTAKRYGVADVFDPAQNVRAGTQHLSELLAFFGNDLALALAAYNAGTDAVLRHGRKIPPFPETLAYVPKVVRVYSQLHD
jgi:soluble lytic murein transglycosylase-like protein